jgi:hypothetical protein
MMNDHFYWAAGLMFRGLSALNKCDEDCSPSVQSCEMVALTPIFQRGEDTGAAI